MNPKTFIVCVLAAVAAMFGTPAFAEEKTPAPAPANVGVPKVETPGPGKNEVAAPERPPAAPEKPVGAPARPAVETAEQPAAKVPEPNQGRPKKDIVATLRLDAMGIGSGNILFGTSTLLLPQVQIGAYVEPFAMRLILGYTYLNEGRSYSYYESSNSDTSEHILAIGGEFAYYFTPIEAGALATYGTFRVARFFVVTSGGSSGNGNESNDAPLLFGAGFGGEWCFTNRFSLGLETGLQIGYTSSESGHSSRDLLLLGFPYGKFTVSAYFF